MIERQGDSILMSSAPARDKLPILSEPLILLITLGTEGDVTPFLNMAAALTRSGRRAILASNANWRDLAALHGVDFQTIAQTDPSQRTRDDLHFFKQQRVPAYHRAAALIRDLSTQNEQLFVVYKASILGAAQAVNELALPSARVILQPASINTQVSPGDRTAFASVRYGAGDVAAAYQAAIRQFHTPASRLERQGSESATPTLLLFPSWFGTPEQGWPENFQSLGFALSPPAPLSSFAGAFLQRNLRPLILTPGTGNHDSSDDLALAEALCAASGGPVVVLDRHLSRPSISANDRILRAPDLDLGAVLRQGRALVHHGGVGTAARGLEAGVPQVVLPDRFDQPENARLLARLGVGAILERSLATAPSILAEVTGLEHRGQFRLRAPQLAQAVRRDGGIGRAVDAVVRLVEEALGRPLNRRPA